MEINVEQHYTKNYKYITWSKGNIRNDPYTALVNGPSFRQRQRRLMLCRSKVHRAIALHLLF